MTPHIIPRRDDHDETEEEGVLGWGKGFWRQRQEDDCELPWPEPDGDWEGRTAFLHALIDVEAVLGAPFVFQMGWSDCRLCGRRNGTLEHYLDDWAWPEGFRHYVEDHLVRPSPEFESYILRQARRLDEIKGTGQ